MLRKATHAPLFVHGETLWLGHKSGVLLRRIFARGRRLDSALDQAADRFAQKCLWRAAGRDGRTRKPGREIARNLHNISLCPAAARGHTTLWSAGGLP